MRHGLYCVGGILLGVASVWASAAAPALPVTTAVAQLIERPAIQEAVGAIVAWQEISVSARTTGLSLVEVRVRVGNRVQKGQLLARFDDAPVRTELAQANAARLQATATAEEAAANSDRARALAKTGSISAQDLLQLTTRAAVARAQLAQAEAALAAARLRLRYTEVTAPDSGVVASRSAMLGQVPQLGSELFRVIAQDRLEWRAELPARQLARIKSGLTVRISLPDGQELTGRVRELSPSLDPSTRLGIVYADLDRSDAVRANMYVKGEIELDRRPVVLVPAESIVMRDGRFFAVTLAGERAKLIPVIPGHRSPDTTEVLSGLTPGQTVVVRGADFLSDGTQVHVYGTGHTPPTVGIATDQPPAPP